MPRAKVRDIEIHYERRGPAGRENAPRLLFISGSGGDLRFKPGTLDGPWPDHFDILAYDQRGLGQTSKPDQPYTMQDYADDAAGIMDAIGWNSARVIGVSFGGMVALELAIRHPARVERLCLACTSPGGAGGASYPLHELAHLSPEERARKMMQIADTRHDDAWAAAHPEEAKRVLAMSHDPYADEPGRAIGARRQLEARAGHDVWDRLGEISAPTLIAAGRYDALALPATQERMLARIKDAKLEFFEGGHGFLQDDPKAIPAIIDFLDGKD
jgi:3-oxoadipate enol-lactonase